MTTKPKASIDPGLENGVVARAEELLPPYEHRLALALDLQGADARFITTRGRAFESAGRIKEIGQELPGASDADRKRLNAERAELAAELAFAPSDVEQAARAYADAYRRWSGQVDHQAQIAIKPLNDQIKPLANQRYSAVNGDTIASLSRQIRPLERRRREFEGLIGLESRRWDGTGPGAIERWVTAVRKQTSRLTPVSEDLRGALRPTSGG